MHEVVTRELASANLAGIVLYIQIQQFHLPPASVRGGGSCGGDDGGFLPRAPVAAVAGRLVDPRRRQQVPLRVLPVAILRLEGVLAVAASVATAVVGVAGVVGVVAGVVAETAREAAPASARWSAVLVVFARRILALRQLTVPLGSRLRARPVRRRRRRIVLVQDPVKAHGSVAARDVVYHGEDGARGGSLPRGRGSRSATRRTGSIVPLRRRAFVIAGSIAVRRPVLGRVLRSALLLIDVARFAGGLRFLSSLLAIRRRIFIVAMMRGRVRPRHGGRRRGDGARRRRRPRCGVRRAVGYGKRGKRGRGCCHEW